MIEIKKYYYLTPALLVVIIFSSNFLSTDLFQAGYTNFSVWFVLSLFSFACGWLINKTFGYNFGGKILFSVIVASAFVSVLLVSIFKEYFGLSDLLVENMILYILRNITLGSMSFFGMAVCEVMILQRESVQSKSKQEDIKKYVASAQREAQLAVDEAKVKADKMLTDVQQSLNEMINRKEQVERRLKEFIQTERELLKAYEKEDEE
ncbi:MAG: hypothetical protein FD143_127 [Ignavibacteria bacterium]|nr:MAG: hypothetical protein FD143_127 [Ignavibacteria bacterium]KAF0162459.1 MAG: hypothetical protein FD188_62 [Ignavibacteria bacterium]